MPTEGTIDLCSHPTKAAREGCKWPWVVAFSASTYLSCHL